METLTNQITTKLRREFVDKFIPIGEQLRIDGLSDYDIIKVYEEYVKSETIKFYKNSHKPRHISETIEYVLSKGADSRIELIYYELLKDQLIPFEFQYKIGKFRADFLINKWLVFEIDGPQHKKAKDEVRDKYMRNLGYDVFRVPAWLASVSYEAVIDEIKELITSTD